MAQLEMFPKPEPMHYIEVTTYIYKRDDGKVVHCNAAMGFIGKEYEHDDPDWQPVPDWPYRIKDLRERG